MRNDDFYIQRIWIQAHGVKNMRQRFIVADLRFIK